jgi:hypothetical protein
MNISKTKCVLLMVCLLSATFARGAETLRGAVTNQTTGRPAAGDDVVLLRLAEGMQEEARTKTDAQGAFALEVTVANAPHVIRVLHQGVNYDQTLSGTAPLEVKVFDAVPKIPGLGGNLGIAQVESDGRFLKVTEMYAITNASNPPRTQFGRSNFDISTPPNAVVDFIQVKGPGGIWVKIPPVLEKGTQTKYGINFPLRPGDTLFKYSYHLPYREPTTLHLKLAYPINNFAVVHAPSLKFKALRQGAFQDTGRANGMELERALGQPLVAEVPAFEISGVGVAPPPPAPKAGISPPAPAQAPPSVATANPAPGPAVHNSNAAANQSGKGTWLLLLAAILVVVLGIVFALRAKKGAAPVKKTSGQPVLEALKEELFQLESDRLKGSISPEEYEATKQALNQSIERVLRRN